MEPTPQPAKAITALQRRTNRSIADQLGYCEHTVGRVLNGSEPPSERFRTGLSALLGLPEQVLFRPVETQASPVEVASDVVPFVRGDFARADVAS